MKNIKRLIIIVLILIVTTGSGFAQIWPFSPLARFGNTVYYPIDSLTNNKLTGTSISFDKKMKNRYFDVLLISDSLSLILNGEIEYFNQKSRIEPKSYKEILFYKRRKLTNDDSKILYLKLIDIEKGKIIAKALVKELTNGQKKKNEYRIEIPLEELSGVFLGAGKNQRIFMTSIMGVACIAGLVVIGL